MRKFQFFLFLIFLLLSCEKRTRPDTANCSDTWTGVTEFGVSTKNVYTNASSIDLSCNLIIAGYTDANLHGNTLTGTYDFFIVKYDNSGTRLWTKLLGVTGQSTYGNAVASDGDESIYVTGYTTGNLDGQTKTGTEDLFITKYDSEGNKKWTRLLGVAGVNTEAYAAAIDSSNNILVAGYTNGNLDSNTKTGSSDLFITKYSSEGVKQWTKLLGVAAVGTQGYGLSTGSADEVYAVGFTNGGLNGNTKTGSIDTFLAKYNSSGALQWVRQQGSAAVSTVGYGTAVDPDGNIYMTGNTMGGLAGNSLTGTLDLFISKYNSSGTRLWTKQLGADSGSITFSFNSSSTDLSGNIYVAGTTDAGLDGNSLIGASDGFITKYNGEGSRQWTKHFGSSPSGALFPLGVKTNPQNHIFIAGYTDSALPGKTLTGSNDTFILKYDSNGTQSILP